MTRLSKKLDYKRTGRYTESMVSDKNAYKLDLPYTIRKHNVFHLSLFHHYTPPSASRHLNRNRRSSTTLTNGKSTESSTLSDATGSSIISYNGRFTVTHGLAGSLRKISGMRRSWLMRSTESIRGSLDDDWTGGMGLDVYGGFTFVTLLWISAQYKWRRHGFYHLRRQVKWRWSFPVHQIRRDVTHRALIGCGTY